MLLAIFTKWKNYVHLSGLPYAINLLRAPVCVFASDEMSSLWRCGQG
jgi:hypothetical protein